jgi:pimeloyl-ACP methyl ester carboxylesterase
MGASNGTQRKHNIASAWPGQSLQSLTAKLDRLLDQRQRLDASTTLGADIILQLPRSDPLSGLTALAVALFNDTAAADELFALFAACYDGLPQQSEDEQWRDVFCLAAVAFNVMIGVSLSGPQGTKTIFSPECEPVEANTLDGCHILLSENLGGWQVDSAFGLKTAPQSRGAAAAHSQATQQYGAIPSIGNPPAVMRPPNAAEATTLQIHVVSDWSPCVKIMCVKYMQGDQSVYHRMTGFSFDMTVPAGSRDVLVWFDIALGSCVWAVDERDGSLLRHREVYHFSQAQGEVTFTIKGSSLRAYVQTIDEVGTTHTPPLIAALDRIHDPERHISVVSDDKLCIKKLSVQFTDELGSFHCRSDSGYDCRVTVPSTARDIIVWMDIVGGSCVWACDGARNDNVLDIREVYHFPHADFEHVQFTIMSTSLHSVVKRVDCDGLVVYHHGLQTEVIPDTPGLNEMYFFESDTKTTISQRAVKFAKYVAAQQTAAGGGAPLRIFLHGFNTSVCQSRRRAKRLTAAMPGGDGNPLIPMLWPSAGRLYCYKRDQQTAALGGHYLAIFLSELARQLEGREVHLIAHSMGNEVLVRGLTQLYGSPPKAPLLNLSVVSVAADVDPALLTGIAASLPAGTWTSYFYPGDLALLVSRVINRQGRSGLQAVEGNVTSIEWLPSTFLTGLMSFHSYIDREAVRGDIAQLLQGSAPGEPHRPRVYQKRNALVLAE